MGSLRIFPEYIFMMILVLYLLNLLLFPKEEDFYVGLKEKRMFVFVAWV